jgi:hypothetical protein
METIRNQQEDFDELKTILGIEDSIESLHKKYFSDVLFSSDLIENTCSLLSKNYLTISENIKSNENLIVMKPEDTGKKTLRIEKLFDNFSEFLNDAECKKLNFTINEKSPSSLLGIINPNNETYKNSSTNFSIDFSNLYFTELKNNFAPLSNLKENRNNSRNEYQNKDREKDFKRVEGNEKNDNAQFRNRNRDKKKNNNPTNYYDKNLENEENSKFNKKSENLGRKISEANEGEKEKQNKGDKNKTKNQENVNNTESKANEKKENPKIIKKSVEEMFGSENINYEVETIEVVKIKKDERNYNGGKKKGEYQNQNYQNYNNYDNRGDYYYGENYNDYTDYSNANFYNNKRPQTNSNSYNNGYNKNNGKNKRFSNKY